MGELRDGRGGSGRGGVGRVGGVGMVSGGGRGEWKVCRNNGVEGGGRGLGLREVEEGKEKKH